MVEPKEEPELRASMPAESEGADFELEQGAYTVNTTLPYGGKGEYQANVVVLTEDDEEVTEALTDPVVHAPFTAGEKVVRMIGGSDKQNPGSATYRLSSVAYLDPDLRADSFNPIPEGEVKEE